jgi:hypothetical protein
VDKARIPEASIRAIERGIRDADAGRVVPSDEARKRILTRIAEARNGQQHGPFANADDAMNFVEREIKRRLRKRKK